MANKLIQILLGEPQGYISETDQFLATLRVEYPTLSASQLAEIAKHEHIAQLRDGHSETEVKTELWRKF